ncbi:MAG: hypothetical protein ABIV94_01025 [Acidimicrobiales bacterium]
MLDLSTAVLCDYAQVRDRLLFVSSGAVSRLYRQELPSPIGIMVGLVIEVPLEDSGLDHQLKAEVINRHGAVLATVQNTFRVGDDGLFPHEVQQVPLVVSITGVQARTWGTHQVRLYLDEELVRALTLYVVPAAGAAEARTQPAVASRQTGAVAPAAEDTGAGTNGDSTIVTTDDADDPASEEDVAAVDLGDGDVASVSDAAGNADPDIAADEDVEVATDSAESTDADANADAAPALDLLSGLDDGEAAADDDSNSDAGGESDSDSDAESDSDEASGTPSGHVVGAPSARGRGRGRRRR